MLDGLQLLRGAFIRLEQHSLDYVAKQVLGEGKTISGRNKAEEILEAFENDRARFVDYNLTDARLVVEILSKLRLVELAVERSRLTGLPPDRVSASVAAFDFLYLMELGARVTLLPVDGTETIGSSKPNSAAARSASFSVSAIQRHVRCMSQLPDR